MDWSLLQDDQAYCRDELRKFGLRVTSETFRRWEKRGLAKLKPGGRSFMVRYLGRAIKRFFGVV